ncbi:MAG: MFS transporter [Halobacteriovoraceae bacterium]|nr:MFS transporter [Halobacteriovoraceae bacterium]MBT5095420.1 MFS transporter [Halobacteriovoraceae bacterium]
MVQSEGLRSNLTKIYGLSGAWMFLLAIPIIVPYFKSIGLSMEEVFQLQSIFAAMVLVLELPSGYIADLLGRKKTLILATFFHALGFSLFPFAESFWQLVATNFFLGVGLSLFSGTDVALIYDTLEALGDRGGQSKLMGKKIFYTQLGETIGALCGGALALVSLNLPVQVNALVQWIPFLIAFTIVEPPRSTMDKKGHLENWKYIYRSLFKHSKLMTLVILNIIFYGAATLIAVWTFQDIWDKLSVPLRYFGILWAFSNITVAVIARKAHVVERYWGTTSTLLIIGILPVFGYLGMGFYPTVWGLLFLLSFQICRGLGMVVLRDALNTRVSADMRATANSVSSLGVRICFIVLGPMMGWIMDNRGFENGYKIFGGIYILVFVVFMIPLIKQVRHMD